MEEVLRYLIVTGEEGDIEAFQQEDEPEQKEEPEQEQEPDEEPAEDRGSDVVAEEK